MTDSTLTKDDISATADNHNTAEDPLHDSNNRSWNAETVTAFHIAFFIFGFIGVVLNLFACIVIAGYKPMRKRLANYFFINQSALDMFIGLSQVLITGLSYVRHAGGWWTYFYCHIINSKFLFTGLLMASTWNLVFMSIERYMEVVHPIRHKLLLTRGRVLGMLVFSWIFGTVFKAAAVIPAMAVIEGVCQGGVYPNAAARAADGIAIVIVEFFIPVSIIAVCYILMFRAMGRVFIASSERETYVPKVRNNILKTVTLVIVCFVLSLGPKEIALFISAAGIVNINLIGPMYTSFMFFNYAMCCLNPIIYLFKYEDFQKGVKVVICRRKPAMIGHQQSISAITPGTL